MNNLSWLLYLAEVLHNLGVFLAVIGLIGIVIGALIFFICLDDDPDFNELRRYRHIIIIPMLFVTLSCLMPSKDTMYAIAASEMGEEVLNSKVGNKAQKALESWLDKQIDTTPEKDKTNGE